MAASKLWSHILVCTAHVYAFPDATFPFHSLEFYITVCRTTVQMCVRLQLKTSQKVPDLLITSQTVYSRCKRAGVIEGRKARSDPSCLQWHSAGRKLWDALLFHLHVSPERTVGLAGSPREAQGFFHLQQLFRQTFPWTASEVLILLMCGRSLSANQCIKFRMPECRIWVTTRRSLEL